MLRVLTNKKSSLLNKESAQWLSVLLSRLQKEESGLVDDDAFSRKKLISHVLIRWKRDDFIHSLTDIICGLSDIWGSVIIIIALNRCICVSQTL